MGLRVDSCSDGGDVTIADESGEWLACFGDAVFFGQLCVEEMENFGLIPFEAEGAQLVMLEACVHGICAELEELADDLYVVLTNSEMERCVVVDVVWT